MDETERQKYLENRFQIEIPPEGYTIVHAEQLEGFFDTFKLCILFRDRLNHDQSLSCGYVDYRFTNILFLSTNKPSYLDLSGLCGTDVSIQWSESFNCYEVTFDAGRLYLQCERVTVEESIPRDPYFNPRMADSRCALPHQTSGHQADRLGNEIGSQVEYFLQNYLHKHWQEECRSTDIQDCWRLFIDNEQGFNPVQALRRFTDLMLELDRLCSQADEQVWFFFSARNYPFLNSNECRRWMSQFRQKLDEFVSTQEIPEELQH